MLKCPKCGHENRPGTFSCEKCFWLLDGEKETIKVSDELRQELSTAYLSYHGNSIELELPPDALQLHFESTHKSVTLMPNDKPYLIGRSNTTNSFLNVDLTPHKGEELGVSRRHATLYRVREGWFIEDLGSTNGTWINEHRLGTNERYIVQSGDILQFGLLIVQVQIR